MADATKLADFQYFQWSRPTAKNPRLSAPISATDTTIVVTNPPLDEDGKIVAKAFLMGIETDGYVETVYVPANAVQGYGNTPDTTNLGLTITGATRGINLAGRDYTTGSSTYRIAHNQDSPVFCNISAIHKAISTGIFLGAVSTGAQTFIGGDETDSNFTIQYRTTGGNKEFLRKNHSGAKAQYSNDGTNWVNIDNAGVGVLTAGNAIDATQLAAGTVQVNPTEDTNVFVKTSSGAGDENKAAILDSAGKFANGFINSDTLANRISDVTATKDEINNALDGISANVTDTNLNTLTGGSDADALHIHGGILLAAGYFSKVGNANNAAENMDETISIAAGYTPGKIVLFIHGEDMYGDTSSEKYTVRQMFSGTTSVSCLLHRITGSGASLLQQDTSAIQMIGVGTNARHCTVTVNSITGGDGNDVTIRSAFAISGSPGTNASTVYIQYEIYAA